MLSDNLIENTNVIVLRNLINNPFKDSWNGSKIYNFVNYSYSTPLMCDRKYYARATIKSDTANITAVMYIQGGAIPGPRGTASTANTEITISGVYYATTSATDFPTTHSSIFNIPHVSTATNYAKDLILYDVTELYRFLLGYGVISSDSDLKTWCDNNLECHLPSDPFLVSTSVDGTGKTVFKTGSVMATSFVAGDSLSWYDTRELGNKSLDNYFDNANVVGTYNNLGNGTVVITRIDGLAQESPFYPKHKYILQITNSGSASPGLGGFYYRHASKANGVFVQKFVAKLPVGYNVGYGTNSQGTGPVIKFIGSVAGTGKWEEYTVLYKCGSSGNFSDGGYIYAADGATGVTWYVAYVSNIDITGLDEDLKYFTVMPNKTIFKNGKIFARNFDTQNQFPNSDLTDTNYKLPNSSWYIDTTDGAGDSNYSIVQPVGATSDINWGSSFQCRINSQAKYKLSYWVKGKINASNFLTAINYYDDNGRSYYHTNFVYVNGTATTLTQELKSGDTEIKVASNANWKKRNYSYIGVRGSGRTWGRPCVNSATYSTYTSFTEGSVSGVSGNDTILLAKAYSGPTLAVGTVIVESYAGNTYRFPFSSIRLIDADTWNYAEFYIGNPGTIYDGSDNIDYNNFTGIPFSATSLHFYLNIYTNNSSNPIKFSDIRLEEVSNSPHSERRENKLQFKVYPNLS